MDEPTSPQAPERQVRNTITGVVVSDAMDKTIVVVHQRRVPHTRYGKIVARRTRYRAHDETNQAHHGDVVEITQTRPLSRTKCWRLVRVVRAASAPEDGKASQETASQEMGR